MQQRPVSQECLAQWATLAPFCRQGFGQAADREEHEGADARQQPEIGFPATDLQQQPAQHRSDDGGNCHGHHERGEHLRGLLRSVEVANHRAREHGAHTGAQCLEKAPQYERLHAVCHRTAHRTDYEQHDADVERKLAPGTVGYRPPEELSQRKTRDEAGDGEFRIAVQRGLHRGQSRQIDVGGQRRERHQGAEDDEKQGRFGVKRGRAHGTVDRDERDACGCQATNVLMWECTDCGSAPMSRLTIDITEQQHQSLKAMAALQGKTIKQYALERLFPGDADADQAWQALQVLLRQRVDNALAGKVSDKDVHQILEEELGKEQP